MLFRSFLRFFSRKLLSRKVQRRTPSRLRFVPQVEALESRELLANDTPFIVYQTVPTPFPLPVDGSNLATGAPTIQIKYSEAMDPTAATSRSNYLLFGSSGQVSVDSVSIDATNTLVTLHYNGNVSGPVTGATNNASPIIITAVDHGLVTGNHVTITNVQGNSNANGTYTITFVDSDRFSLDGRVGSGNYVSGTGTWALTGNITLTSGAGVPIQVTSNSHGLKTGNKVTIAGVAGNTNANATWIVTVNDANTFTLNGSTGNAAYGGGGTWTANQSLVVDTYTLYVRGDKLVDVDDGRPLAPPGQIVVANAGQNRVAVAGLPGNGTIGAAGEYSLPNVGPQAPNPNALVFADFNQDGLADLAVVNAGTNQVAIYAGGTSESGGGFSQTPDLLLDLPAGTANQAKSIIVADLNNDNKPDITVTNFATNNISVFLNNGASSLSFGGRTDTATSTGPVQLAAADLDADGIVDLVVAVNSATSFDVLKGTGGGAFAAAVPTAVAAVGTPSSIGIGFIDEDNKPDVVVGGSTGLAWLRNTSPNPGTVSFAAPTLINGTAVVALAVGALDAGIADDIVTTTATQAVAWQNDGLGTLAATNYNIAAGTAGRVGLGDLNADGRNDIAVTSGVAAGRVTTLVNHLVGGTISAIATNPANEYVVTSRAHGLLSGQRITIAGVVGSSGFDSNNGGSNPANWTVTMIDANTFSLNGSSYTGAGSYTRGGTWALTGGITAGSIVSTNIQFTSNAHGLKTGDKVTITGVTGTGDAGSWAANANGTFVVTVLDANRFSVTPGTLPTGTYASGGIWVTGANFVLPASNPYAVDATPIGVAIADTNEDGFGDVVTANNTANNFSLLGGAGNGSLLTQTSYGLAPNQTRNVAVGDLNRDGIPDIVVVNNNNSTGSTRASVLLGQVGGSYASAVDFSVGSSNVRNVVGVAIGDVNGDNAPDILVLSSTDDRISILQNNTPANSTNPSFAVIGTVNTGGTPNALVLADLDKDGDLDILVSHNRTGKGSSQGVTRLLGNGNGTFTNAGESVSKTPLVGVAIGDFNKDGFLDFVAIEDSAPGNVHLRLGDGSGGFTTGGGPYATGVPNPTDLVVADFNGDGFQDIAVTSRSTNLTNAGVAILLNQLGTGFGTPLQFDVVPGTGLASIISTDLNQDGIQDLVVSTLSGASTTDNVYALLGNGNGTFNPAVPYLVGNFGTPTAPSSYLAITGNPLMRVSTFTSGGSLIAASVLNNGDFESRDLSGEVGDLLGWQTFRLGTGSGSYGQWLPQAGSLSPLSATGVPAPAGKYRAMLDQAHQDPYWTTPANPNPASSYAGTNVLYQDVFIPPNTTNISFSMSLFINNTMANAYTDTSGNPSLDFNTGGVGGNQQLRVDVVDPAAGILDVGAGVLRNLFITNAGMSSTLTQTVSWNATAAELQALLTGFPLGRTVRLRIAAANNQGQFIVGVDNVKLAAQFNDGGAPTISGLGLRNPGFLGNPNGNTPHTSDPTLVGTIGDNGGLSNIAYIQFDVAGDGFGNADDVKTTQWDARGKFSVTLPGIAPGLNTINVQIADKPGNLSQYAFTFYMQAASVTEWQAVGPQGIDVSGQNVDYTKVSGRITVILPDNGDPTGNSYYIGSANGGVWKTTDGGADWTPLTDYVTDNGLPTGNPLQVPIGGLGQSERNSDGTPNTNVLYAGTGVGDLALDSHAGIGVLKSVDGGKTWQLAGNSGTVLAGARVTKVVVHEDNHNIVYVAVAAGGLDGPGVYRTLDGGSTWVNVMKPNGSNMTLGTGAFVAAGTAIASVTDLIVDPFHPDRIFVGLGNIGLTAAPSAIAGVWSSIGNQGASWTQIVGGISGVANTMLPAASTAMGRVTLAMGNGRLGDEDYGYVLIGTAPGNLVAPSVDYGSFTGLYKTRDNWRNFTKVMLKQDIGVGFDRDFRDIDLLSKEASNVGALAVDPVNPNVVYVGGSRRWDPAAALPQVKHALIRVDTGNMRDYITNPTGTWANDGDDINKGAKAETQVFGGVRYYDYTPTPPTPPGNTDPYVGEGVYWYDIEQAEASENGNKRLLPPAITDLAIDAQGRLVIGTVGGIWRGQNLGFGYDPYSGGRGILSGKGTNFSTAGMSLTSINGNLQISDMTSVAVDPLNPGVYYTTQMDTGVAGSSQPLVWVSQGLTGPVVGGTNLGIPNAGYVLTALPTGTPIVSTNAVNGSVVTVNSPGHGLSNGSVINILNNSLINGNFTITVVDANNFTLNSTSANGTGSGGSWVSEGTPVTLFRVWQYADNRALQPETSTDNGVTWTTLAGIDDPVNPFLKAGTFPAFAINPNKLLIGGQYNDELLFGTNIKNTGAFGPANAGAIWVTQTSGNVWDNIASGALTNAPLPGLITALGIFPRTNTQSQPAAYYVGTNLGEVYVTLNGGADGWPKRVTGLPVPGRKINAITVDPNNPQVAYVVLDGPAGTPAIAGHVWRTTNGGVTWTNISDPATSGLPNVAAYKLVIDPRVGLGAPNGKIYVATEVGVYLSLNGGTAWTKLGQGLPNAPVTDLNFTASIETLAAATFGRGVFVINTTAISKIPDQILETNTSNAAKPYAFTINDNGFTGYTLTALSDNQLLVPNANLVIGGSGANRTLTVTPRTNQKGTAIITIRAFDGTNTFTSSFHLTVDGPSLILAPSTPFVNNGFAFSHTITSFPTVLLQGNTPFTSPLSYAVEAYIDSPAARAYVQDQTLDLSAVGTNYNLNQRGANEKYLQDNLGQLYYLLSDGRFYRFTGVIDTSPTSPNLLATFDASFWADPAKVWNAVEPADVANTYFDLTGTTLSFKLPASRTKVNLHVKTSVSDNFSADTKFFTVDISNVKPSLSIATSQPAPWSFPHAQTPFPEATLNGTDADTTGPGVQDTLTYYRKVYEDNAAYRAYDLMRARGLMNPGSGNFFFNARGAGERYLISSTGQWHYILADGRVYQWAGFLDTSPTSPNLITTLDSTYAANPNLILAATTPPTDVAASYTNISQLTKKITFITPLTYAGGLVIVAGVTDGIESAEQTIRATITNNDPTIGILQGGSPLSADLTFSHAASFPTNIELRGTDADTGGGNPDVLSYSVQAFLDTAAARAYRLRVERGLVNPGNNFSFNFRGAQEKYLFSTTGQWYYILSDGRFYRWAGFVDTSPTSANLLTTLNTGYWANPDLIVNASIPDAWTTHTAAAFTQDQNLGLFDPGNNYLQNFRGANEKYLQGAGGLWYYLLPDGRFYRWAGFLDTSPTSASLVATFDSTYWADPSLLWNAQNIGTKTFATANASTGAITFGNDLRSFMGSLLFQGTVTDGIKPASALFGVTVTNADPTLAVLQGTTPVTEVTFSHAAALPTDIVFQGTDADATLPNPDVLTYSAQVFLDTSAARAYRLRMERGLVNPGNNFSFNFRGAQEKYLFSTTGQWYYILSDGRFYRWAGFVDTSPTSPNLLATLDTGYWVNPDLIVTAPAPAAWTTHTAAAFTQDQNLGLNDPGSNYLLNLRGGAEKYLQGTGNIWYYILPDGRFYRWAGFLDTALVSTNLLATYDPTYWADPSLLWNAQNIGSKTFATVNASTGAVTFGNDIRTFAGSLLIYGDVTDSIKKVSAALKVMVTNVEPTLNILQAGQPVNGDVNVDRNNPPNDLALQAVDADTGAANPDTLTYSAQVYLDTPAARAYRLKIERGLLNPGSNFLFNARGAGEKYLFSTTGQTYYILSNGRFYQWAGSLDTSPTSPNLITTLDVAYWTNPDLIVNAVAPAAWTTHAAAAFTQDQNLGLFDPGNNYSFNQRGANEKYLQGTGGLWYYILPNGRFYRWTGVLDTSPTSTNLLAAFDITYWADPRTLWNAPNIGLTTYLNVNSTSGAISFTGNIQNVFGSLIVEAEVTDGLVRKKRFVRLAVN